MNLGKMGRPFTLTRGYIQFLAVVRYLFGMPYRQLEGFTYALHRLMPKLPSGDYSGLRRRILGLDMNPHEGLRDSPEPVVIAVDVTGIKVPGRGMGGAEARQEEEVCEAPLRGERGD